MDFFQRQRPMFTEKEQDRLSEAVVFIAGAGGLGTYQAVQLQRAGVKKIYLMDYDRVEATNLNRQVLYGRGDIGRSKVLAARERLLEFELETEIEIIEGRIGEDTEIPSDSDLILEALDNFQTRYTVCDLAYKYDLPLVHGGVEAWYGQLTTIIPGESRGLKDIISEPPASEGPTPVFSPVVSTIASLQVTEAVKILIGRENEELLVNKLLVVDLREYQIDVINLDQQF
ncbi:MAG: HesA/MoeB/ThiF family protein [Halanaerobiales bacterium]